jgi:dienelactone hydrolase
MRSHNRPSVARFLFLAAAALGTLTGTVQGEDTPGPQWARRDLLPVNLLNHFDNDGIACPPETNDGNFDCPQHAENVPGSSYPGEKMPLPGEIFRLKTDIEVHFLFPSREPGELNNASCNGQNLDFEDGRFSAAYMLGASENGDYSADFGLNYIEGPEKAAVGLTDWCKEARHGEKTAFEFPYRYGWLPDGKGMGKEDLTCRLWLQKVRLDPQKTLQSISLPYQRRMHLFALTLVTGQPTKEMLEQAAEVTEAYFELRSRKPVYTEDIRALANPVRRQVEAAAKVAKSQRGYQWLLTYLDYVDSFLPQPSGRVSPKHVSLAKQILGMVGNDFQTLLDGGDPFLTRRGQLLRSYYSPLDDSWQAYGLAVPGDYTGAQAYPLVVSLHGHGGYRPFQCLPPKTVPGVIIVTPQGRGSADFMLAAEEDVLRVTEEVQKDFRIDPNRVILEGHSMGGTGSWNIGVKFPDRFSCIAPVMGNTDHEVLYVDRDPLPAPAKGFGPLMVFLLAVNDPISYAQNLSNIPVFCGHGALDNVVRVQHSQRMVGRLKELGNHPVYGEFGKVFHGGFPQSFYDERWGWMLRQRRNPRPAKVRYRTARLRYDGAYWIRIRGLERWGEFAEVSAEQAAAGDVSVQTRNVSSLSILVDRLPELPVDKLTVKVDGQTAYEGHPVGSLRLEKADGVWQGERQAEGLSKRKGLEGPVSDALLSPFLIVYGTVAENPLWNRVTRSEAEQLAAEWQRRYFTRPRIKPDTEVTDEDIRQYNLLLYGGPAENALSGKVCPDLPVQIVENTVRLGDLTFEGKGLAFKLCYPNPLNPERYVVVSAAVEPMGLWQVNSRFGNFTGWDPLDNWDWFDYAVFDDRTCGADTALCVGFFGPDWAADVRSRWIGDPERRRQSGPRALPATADLPTAAPETLWLSDLMPVRVGQARGEVRLDRSYRGNVLRVGSREMAKGFGVRVPSEIEFSLKKKFRRLSLEYGVDLEGATTVPMMRASAEWLRFGVWGDGRRLWSSEWIQWHHQCPPVEVDIEGVDLLRLQLDGGGSTWLYGSAAWGNPKLLR